MILFFILFLIYKNYFKDFNNFLNEKRNRDYNNNSIENLKKNQQLDILEVMLNVFNKFKSLSKDNLKKELKKNEIPINEIDMKLDVLLRNYCTRYKESGEIMYFLKN